MDFGLHSGVRARGRAVVVVVAAPLVSCAHVLPSRRRRRALGLSTTWPLPDAQEIAEEGPRWDTVPGPSTCQPSTQAVLATVQVGQAHAREPGAVGGGAIVPAQDGRSGGD
jgi:hypothetical protein